MKKISEEHIAFIKEANKFLENDSVLMKIANAIGKPIELIQNSLPEKAKDIVEGSVDKALKLSLKTAFNTIPEKSPETQWNEMVRTSTSSRWKHNSLATLSGGIGGMFGEVGLIFDLPVTTTLIMRNIAQTATKFQFDQTHPETAFECLSVFTLGSKSSHDDQIDSSYYTNRAALATALSRSAEFMANNSARVVLENIEKGTAPQLLTFIAKVADYFGLVVTEKMLVEAIPIVGSVGAASINLAFCDYFGQAAKYHFGILYLENLYGKEMIEEVYLNIKNKKSA